MTCTACGTRGLYDWRCLDCCARQVLSTYPSRQHAAAMLEAIGLFLRRLDAPPFEVQDVSARAREMRGDHEVRAAVAAREALAECKAALGAARTPGQAVPKGLLGDGAAAGSKAPGR